MDKNHDIIIVGAGISGLSAAYQISKSNPNLKVIVLEAKNRIGGRTLSTQLKTANGFDTFEMGGTWVGKSQTPIMELLKELCLEIYPQYYEGRKFLQVGDKKQITSYTGSIPSLGILSLIDIHRLVKKFEGEQAKTSISDPSGAPFAEALDCQTALSYVKGNSLTFGSLDSMNAALRTIFGVESERISALYMMAFANASGGFLHLMESSESSVQGYKIKGGSQQICEKLLEKIGSDNLALNSPVMEVKQDDDLVHITVKSGQCYTSKFAIFAIPPHLLANITFEPHLPIKKMEFIQSVCPGHLIKVYITFKTAFWRELGYSGEIVTNGGESRTPGCSSGPLCITFDATNSNGSPALVCFIGGKQSIEYCDKSKEERQEAVLRSLEDFFPSEKVRDFIHYEEKNWYEEPYNGGCPVVIIPPGMARFMNEGLRTNHGRVHFASTEAATVDSGYMSGAVQSGYSAAKEILERLGS